MLSVVLCTKRQNPKFEWAIEALKAQTYKDFEYIVVDGLYEERGKQVSKLFADVPFKVKYLPDKPCIWKGIRTALANSRNTAFIFAEGDQVVFHDDCCKPENDWLERHAKYAEYGYCVAGTWISYEKEWEYGPYGLEGRAKGITKPQPCGGGWLYGGNFSVPLEAALAVNGNDEMYCGAIGVEDCDFGIRVQRAGYQSMFDPQCVVKYVVNPSDVGTIQYFTNKPETYDNTVKMGGDWDQEKKAQPKERMLNDGKLHFANEWLIQLLMKQESRYWTLGNSFELKQLREHWFDYSLTEDTGNVLEKFYKWLENWKYPFDYDWRDGEKIEGMRK